MILAPSEDSDQIRLGGVFAVRSVDSWGPMQTAKTIRLGGCPIWSESSLGAKVFYFCYEAAHVYPNDPKFRANSLAKSHQDLHCIFKTHCSQWRSQTEENMDFQLWKPENCIKNTSFTTFYGCSSVSASASLRHWPFIGLYDKTVFFTFKRIIAVFFRYPIFCPVYTWQKSQGYSGLLCYIYEPVWIDNVKLLHVHEKPIPNAIKNMIFVSVSYAW